MANVKENTPETDACLPVTHHRDRLIRVEIRGRFGAGWAIITHQLLEHNQRLKEKPGHRHDTDERALLT